MAAAIGAGTVLVGLLLVFGPFIRRWLEGVLEADVALSWVWWTVQWPILVVRPACGVRRPPLLRARHPAPALAVRDTRVARRRRRLARRLERLLGVREHVRLLQQGLGLVLGGHRDTDLALAHRARALFGGEVNAEVERSRELRQGPRRGARRRAQVRFRRVSWSPDAGRRPVERDPRASRRRLGRGEAHVRRGGGEPSARPPPRSRPWGPGRVGSELRFQLRRRGGGPENVRNLLGRLDEKRIWGSSSSSTLGSRRRRRRHLRPGGAWPTPGTTRSRGSRPAGATSSASSSSSRATTSRAALLGAPLNPTRRRTPSLSASASRATEATARRRGWRGAASSAWTPRASQAVSRSCTASRTRTTSARRGPSGASAAGRSSPRPRS